MLFISFAVIVVIMSLFRVMGMKTQESQLVRELWKNVAIGGVATRNLSSIANLHPLIKSVGFRKMESKSREIQEKSSFSLKQQTMFDKENQLIIIRKLSAKYSDVYHRRKHLISTTNMIIIYNKVTRRNYEKIKSCSGEKGVWNEEPKSI